MSRYHRLPLPLRVLVPLAIVTAVAAAVVGTLTITGHKPPGVDETVAAASVMVSPIPPLGALDGSLHGAQVGAPAQPKKHVAAASVRVVVNQSVARGILTEVNRVRRSHGLRALKAAPDLVRAGNGHARFLAASGMFTHDWQPGTPFGRWILRFYPATNTRMWSAGENLLWWPETVTPRAAVQRWLASPPHRKVMLAPRWRQLGVGVVDAANAPGVYNGQKVVVVAAEFGLRVR